MIYLEAVINTIEALTVPSALEIDQHTIAKVIMVNLLHIIIGIVNNRYSYQKLLMTTFIMAFYKLTFSAHSVP